jgi:hypothetical protein
MVCNNIQLHTSQVKVVRLGDAKEPDDETPKEKNVLRRTAGGSSFYCPYRAWCFSRKWIDEPEGHIYCGRSTCWAKYNSTLFHGKELKVINDIAISDMHSK